MDMTCGRRLNASPSSRCRTQQPLIVQHSSSTFLWSVFSVFIFCRSDSNNKNSDGGDTSFAFSSLSSLFLVVSLNFLAELLFYLYLFFRFNLFFLCTQFYSLCSRSFCCSFIFIHSLSFLFLASFHILVLSVSPFFVALMCTS